MINKYRSNWTHLRHRSLGSTKGSGKLYVGEHAPKSSYSQKLVIWALLRLRTPRANMNAPIRDAFDCSSRKPMRRHFISGFPKALLSLSQKKSSGVETGIGLHSVLLPLVTRVYTPFEAGYQWLHAFEAKNLAIEFLFPFHLLPEPFACFEYNYPHLQAWFNFTWRHRRHLVDKNKWWGKRPLIGFLCSSPSICTLHYITPLSPLSQKRLQTT